MSTGKKVPGGKGTSDVRKGTDGHSDPKSEADRDMDQSEKATPRSRARNQDVLPEILGKQLRAAYGELLNAPVPDNFNELIKRLESREKAAGPAKPGKPPPEENGQ